MTAVEWLLQELKEYSTTLAYAQDSFVIKIPKEDMVKMINQAKEMEKEQIMTAHGLKYYDITEETITGEQYYNETYGQERE